ncbi:g5157 [Coccomyxa elongata]
MQSVGALRSPLPSAVPSCQTVHSQGKPLCLGRPVCRQPRSSSMSVRAVVDGVEDSSDDTWEDPRGRGRRGRGGREGGMGRRGPPGQQEEEKEYAERVVQVSRVTKVVKGGKSMSFRAVVVVGNEKGTVGVGTATAKEVIDAVQKAVTDAKKHFITVPLTRSSSFPHRFDGIFGAAKVMLRPAAEGTGVIAGGAVRVVLELAGIKNAFGKQLGSGNPLNNARATIEGLRAQRTLQMVADERGLSIADLMGYTLERSRKAAEGPSEEAAVPITA